LFFAYNPINPADYKSRRRLLPYEVPPSARKVFLRRTRRRKKRISSFSRRSGGANSVRLYVRPCTGAALPHLHFLDLQPSGGGKAVKVPT
jgi:hypothetical protein